MSRHIEPDEVYINTSHGLLPIRWMAVESLFYNQFTSASDVWSYGIVIWEICTLGKVWSHGIVIWGYAHWVRWGLMVEMCTLGKVWSYGVWETCTLGKDLPLFQYSLS